MTHVIPIRENGGILEKCTLESQLTLKKKLISINIIVQSSFLLL